MGGWRWEDLGWRERVGQDPAKILQEALRRAVDIRDQADKSRIGARTVFLVEVLNELCKVLEIDGSKLWDPLGQQPPPNSGGRRGTLP